jgi:hypothetical protein
MNTPNFPFDEIENSQPEWRNPFPEPQTIPCGWNLSQVLSTPAVAISKESAENADD